MADGTHCLLFRVALAGITTPSTTRGRLGYTEAADTTAAWHLHLLAHYSSSYKQTSQVGGPWVSYGPEEGMGRLSAARGMMYKSDIELLR